MHGVRLDGWILCDKYMPTGGCKRFVWFLQAHIFLDFELLEGECSTELLRDGY